MRFAIVTAQMSGSLIDYIDHCERYLAVLEKGEDSEDLAAEAESRFLELIETDSWWLADADGQYIPILAPAFATGNELTWRYDCDA